MQIIEFPSMRIWVFDDGRIELHPPTGWHVELAQLILDGYVSFSNAIKAVEEWRKWAWMIFNAQVLSWQAESRSVELAQSI